jgi:hypothetical protein
VEFNGRRFPHPPADVFFYRTTAQTLTLKDGGNPNRMLGDFSIVRVAYPANPRIALARFPPTV